ncbi:hypothetical protein B0H16DRAFT_1727033 [Mycena metata]|uniref:Uncharacterized protein n=1 Tax=Mycena metata TaxID=1033252 RepID=A0AAD7N3R8_9AGAR|nr:hypothetical protein B0H16DRAFT_1727033 [Mycena metata]
MSSVEATTSLPTARGDAADDTAWSKYPPDVSLAKAEVPPLSTPRLCLRAEHAAHDHYDDDHPPPTPLESTSTAYLLLFLDLPAYCVVAAGW